MSLRDTVPKKIYEIFKKFFLPKSQQDLKEIYQSIQPILEEVEKIDKILDSFQSDKILKEISASKEAIYLLIKDMWTKPVGWDFSDKYSDFLDGIQDYIEELPPYHVEEQSSDRFIAVKADRWFIRFKKFIKYKIYQIGKIPVRFFNWILRVFKKAPRPIYLWNHTISVRNTVRKVYQTELSKKLMEAEKIKYQLLVGTILSLKMIENNSDIVIAYENDNISLKKFSDQNTKDQFEKIKKEISTNEKKYVKEAREAVAFGEAQFLENMDKAGTMELPKKLLNNKNLQRRFKRYNDLWLDNSKDWNRTLYALFDDWRLDLEINGLKYIAYQELFQVKKQLNKEKREYLNSLMKISDILKGIEASINKKSGISRKELQNVKFTIQKKVNDGMIPEIIDQFDSKTLIGILRQIEIKLESEIDSISESRALVKTDQYSRPLKEQDVSYIQPDELIQFEVYPRLLNLTAHLKNSIFNQLTAIIKLIPDIDNIVLFSIETAINTTDPLKEQISPENTQIILNGIGRANNRISDIQQLIYKLFGSYEKELIDAIQKFTDDAVLLMQNENALDIRIKLLKAKALQQTKSYQDKLKGHFIRIFNQFKDLYKTRIPDLYLKYKAIRKRFFLQPSDAVVTQEISDFLSESEKSITQLPIIYRRLYKVEPVTDMDLFIGRENEYEELKSSYQNMLNGRSSSTAIIGEKWGGLTSFINYMIENMNFEYPIIRIRPDEKYYHKDKLYHFLADSLSIDHFSDQQELINTIKNLTSKRIVIIEDIQHMYLRSVDGFDAIRALIEIIYRTQKDIFWILTCTQYAWNYLVKSIQVNDYFHKVVMMKPMNNEEVNHVIRKRNQIGGFKIIFNPPEEIMENKKFKSISEEEQQIMLEKRFFRKLNDFASSNISMALIFWLLSTKKVTDDHIIVGDFVNPDQSFIHVMTQTRIFILLALILHDGISLAELSIVNNERVENLGLQISSLEEDGIVIRKSDLFIVNPLIYRNVVSVLKLKNLIH